MTTYVGVCRPMTMSRTDICQCTPTYVASRPPLTSLPHMLVRDPADARLRIKLPPECFTIQLPPSCHLRAVHLVGTHAHARHTAKTIVISGLLCAAVHTTCPRDAAGTPTPAPAPAPAESQHTEVLSTHHLHSSRPHLLRCRSHAPWS